MAFIPELPLVLQNPVAFPRTQAYTRYQFGEANKMEEHELIDCLHAYLNNELPARYPIQPLDFTNFLTYDLHTHYGVSYAQFLKKRIFFFHHFLAHPQKGDIDYTQKNDNVTLEWSMWKKYGNVTGVFNEYGYYVGYKTLYALYEKDVNKVEEESTNYKLEVFRLPDCALTAAGEITETKKSAWGLVRLSRSRYAP